MKRFYKIPAFFVLTLSLLISFSLNTSAVGYTYRRLAGYPNVHGIDVSAIFNVNDTDRLYIAPATVHLNNGNFVRPIGGTQVWQLIQLRTTFNKYITNYNFSTPNTVPLFEYFDTIYRNEGRFQIPSWFGTWTGMGNNNGVVYLPLNGTLTIPKGYVLEFYITSSYGDFVDTNFGNIILNDGNVVNFNGVSNVLDYSAANWQNGASSLVFDIEYVNGYVLIVDNVSQVCDYYRVRSRPLDRDIVISSIGFQFSTATSYNWTQIKYYFCSFGISAAILYDSNGFGEPPRDVDWPDLGDLVGETVVLRDWDDYNDILDDLLDGGYYKQGLDEVRTYLEYILTEYSPFIFTALILVIGILLLRIFFGR